MSVDADDAARLPMHVLKLCLLAYHVLERAVREFSREGPKQLLAKVHVRVSGGQAHDERAAALRRILLFQQTLLRQAIGGVDRRVCERMRVNSKRALAGQQERTRN